ncbi:transmembrane protein 198-like isoform X1 [Mytilus galloprovincialis]|uniref:Transmembrane protein 198 n=2 Tax=Mytilus TaxID=6548 RepID=A0A8S3RXV3_MYTED|nr:Transmembrane protein 198 [Mytilus edulis]
MDGRILLRRLLQSSTPTIYIDGDPEENSTVIIPSTPKPVTHTLKSCDHIDTDYDVALAIICAMSFIFGIIYTFFGYRFFKAVMFLTGFIFISVLTYLILSEQDILPLGGEIGVAVGAGLILGIITMLVQYIGLFLTGFQFGLSIAMCILVVLEQFYHPTTRWIPIAILCGVGLFFGVLTLKFQKTFTVLGTSIFGGALMISCLDYFIEKFTMLIYIWERAKGDLSDHVCWYSWVLLGCWPFCFIVGTVAQWRITGQGYDHRDTSVGRKNKKVSLQKVRKRQHEPDTQSRYRHLYKARRTTGDVISQSYLQNIQERFSPSLKRHSHTPIPTEPSQTELDSASTTLTQIT